MDLFEPKAKVAVLAWWDSLSDQGRQELAGLWDERRETIFFTPQPDEQGSADSWEAVPSVAGGKFIPADDVNRDMDSGEKLEYLIDLAEIVLAYEPAIRVFHIGRR